MDEPLGKKNDDEEQCFLNSLGFRESNNGKLFRGA